jgi:hypothetical protein
VNNVSIGLHIIYFPGQGKPTIAPVFFSGRNYLRITESLVLLHREMLKDLSRRLGVRVFHGVGVQRAGCQKVWMNLIEPSSNVTDVELNQSNHVRSVAESKIDYYSWLVMGNSF